jgi:photosystem I subunit 3
LLQKRLLLKNITTIIMNKILNFILLGLLTFSTPSIASAEIGGLNSCGESVAFQKRLGKSVKKLEGRLKKYEVASPPYIAIEKQIEQTKVRFSRYSNSNLLCGNDGLPHLVADGRWSHAAEFMIPGIMFLYISGWIGWVGRKYIRTVRQTANPTEKEIIIDVPLAISIMASGFLWPLSATQEFLKGDFVARDTSVTISPR